MDYEKKYKKALGWMQSLYNGLHGKTKEEAERYFPELKDEDEKIRKWIIGVLSTYEHDKGLRNAALAWLEKQGEQKSRRMISAEAKEAMYDKPAWSEEDEDVISHLLTICHGAKKFIQFESCSQEDIIKCQNWLTSLKERM